MYNETLIGYDISNESHYTFSLFGNTTEVTQQTNRSNDSYGGFGFYPEHYGLVHLLCTSIILGCMILCTIIGNVFVVAAIILERNLQSVANYLIMSLAVADLMVATLVMPISAVHEVTSKWFLGAEVCDLWISFDVLCCTASILHLVAIALDRYWAVTQVDYIRQRTAKRIIFMIILVWGFSICISIPPLFGWKDNNNPYESGVCQISQDWGYTIFSTFGAFYMPLIVMMVIYYKIFRAARHRIRKRNFINDANKNNKALLTVDAPLRNDREHTNYGNTLIVPDSPSVNHVSVNSDSNKVVFNPKRTPNLSNMRKNKNPSRPPRDRSRERTRERQKEKLEHKRERKAARTLAIITGCFIICWFPFFILALVAPFVKDISIFPNLAFSVVLWLGYLNSLLNPVIYTVFNPDFRNAFRKILFGKYRNRQPGRRR
ncbi:5-hydroxytryptamine receptor-like [Lineus longissimus]|uniref:5-hydroxytryptamine receptor-like n=1 Tax=Lineus longissimus TaxID=88925 RepID=UPI00315DFB4C